MRIRLRKGPGSPQPPSALHPTKVHLDPHTQDRKTLTVSLPSQSGIMKGEETENGCVEKAQSCYKHSNLGTTVHQIMRNFLLLFVLNGVLFVCFPVLIPWLPVLKIIQGTERKGNNCCVEGNKKLLCSSF